MTSKLKDKNSNIKARTQKSKLFERIYDLVRKVPRGKVTTYGEIARVLGTRDARKVGWAMHANPHGVKVPCHRVVNKKGGLAPNFAFDGWREQKRRLVKEGVLFKDQTHVDLEQCLWVESD